jgi:hypothetical protein
MYEYVSVQEIVDKVLHIYGLYRDTADLRPDRSEVDSVRLNFLRGVVDRLRHGKSTLSPRMLAELARHAGLTLGGAFRLVGYPLDKLREAEYLLNGHRTRIIESYPFYLDREVDLPKVLSSLEVLHRTAFVSEIVREWQMKQPVRSVLERGWGRDEMFYVQVGQEDGAALSGIPPGAIVSVGPLSPGEARQPDPNAIYCLQFRDGYRCSGCALADGGLNLLPYMFLYPEEVRIIGRAHGFAVSLQQAAARESIEVPRIKSTAPLVLPWEQQSLATLWRTTRLRFGLGEQALKRANDIFASQLGVTLSRRTLRRYRYHADMMPHTDKLVAMTLFHSTRFSDVFRLLGFLPDESSRHSLATWDRAQSLNSLRTARRSAVQPEPGPQWQSILDLWGEWPALLSMALPELGKLQYQLLRIEQSQIFDGLSPLLMPGTIALIEEMSEFPAAHADWSAHEWERPIYAIRYKDQILCGHLYNDGEHITLLPHTRSHARRLSFFRHQVEMVGRWMGVAAPLPYGSGSASSRGAAQ